MFSLVVKHTSIRILMPLGTHLNWEIEKLDVKTVFLHGDLDENIYTNQLESFIKPGNEELVCLLKKSLYGLKQSPSWWYIGDLTHMFLKLFSKRAAMMGFYIIRSYQITSCCCFLSMWMKCC